MVKIIIAFVVGLCLGTHRRVIKSLITGSEMPKAPSWHVWTKNREKNK